MNQRTQGFDFSEEDYRQQVDKCLASLGGRDSLYYNRLKVWWLLRLCKRQWEAIGTKDYLDLGAGMGAAEKHLEGHFRFAAALDSSRTMIRAAAEQTGKGAAFLLGDAARLPFADCSFDLVFIMTLLHHLKEDALFQAFQETRRVLRPGGLAVHFDHNPYNFLTRKVVERCEFDEGAVMRPKRFIAKAMRESGLQVVESGYLAFIPRFLQRLDFLEPALKPLPLGAQFFVAGVKKSP